jgi:hypothetical protein
MEQRRELASGQLRKQARQEVVREEQKKVGIRPPPRIEARGPVAEKSDRVERERQVPLFDAPKSSELPALSLLDEPGTARALLFRRGPGGHVAPGGNQAARFRHRG